MQPASLSASSLAVVGLAIGLSALSAACSYSSHRNVLANGLEGQLEFSDVGPSSDHYAVGSAHRLTVARFNAADVTCKGVGNASVAPSSDLDGRVRTLSGGGVPIGDLVPDDRCGTQQAEPAELVSATCDDNACTVTSESTSNGDVVLHVLGTKEADSRLHVTLKTTKDSASYTDSILIAFGKASRIKLFDHSIVGVATKAPALPGLTFDAPTATLVDADGKNLVVDEGALRMTIEGPAYAAVDAPAAQSALALPQLKAVAPGRSTLRWEVANVMSRTIDLEVVDQKHAKELQVFSFPKTADRGGLHSTGAVDLDLGTGVDNPLALVDPPLKSLLVDGANANDVDYSFTTRIVLDDGRLAIAALDAVTLSVPKTMLVVLDSHWEPFSFVFGDPTAEGTGTITVRAGGLTTALPLDVRVASRKK